MQPVDVAKIRVGLVGYGEVGIILGRDLAARGVAWVRAYDRIAGKTGDRAIVTATAIEAVRDADLVISAVTASQTRDAVESIVAGLAPGAFVVDVNSASPATKIACAALVEKRGGRYVEMAVMTSIPPRGLATPMLAGGPHAAASLALLAALGFKVEIASDSYGVASAIKMCRSVIVKGMEAIVIEGFATARKYGVEAEVLASLAETFPGLDWERNGGYFFQRVMQHGRRRAEEMREAAVTVREAGIEPLMASATAERDEWVADLVAAGAIARAEGKGWREHADAMTGSTESIDHLAARADAKMR